MEEIKIEILVLRGTVATGRTIASASISVVDAARE